MISRITSFFAALAISSTVAFAQSSEREINKEFYKADAQLSIVINYLPTAWVFSADQEFFLITAPDSAWVLEENMADSRAESKESRTERIKKSGTRILPQVVIRFEEKWSSDKVQMAKIGNAAIDDEIRKLPAKYHIQHLADTIQSSKSKKVFTATNDKETRLIAQYNNELNQLIAQRVKLPDFHSEKYSLFIYSITGADDENHLVYPANASLEVYTVLSTFREICGK